MQVMSGMSDAASKASSPPFERPYRATRSKPERFKNAAARSTDSSGTSTSSAGRPGTFQ